MTPDQLIAARADERVEVAHLVDEDGDAFHMVIDGLVVAYVPEWAAA